MNLHYGSYIYELGTTESIVCLFAGSYSQGVEYWIKSDP